MLKAILAPPLSFTPRFLHSFYVLRVSFDQMRCQDEGHKLYHVYTLQRQNTEFLKQIFPEKEYRGLGPNFHIHASVSDLYISTIGLPILLEEICRPNLGLYKSLTDT